MTLSQCQSINVQTMQRCVIWKFGEDGTRPTAYFQQATLIVQACSLEKIPSQVASPSGLLEVAFMPIHRSMLTCKSASTRRAEGCPALCLSIPAQAERRRQVPHKARPCQPHLELSLPAHHRPRDSRQNKEQAGQT